MGPERFNWHWKVKKIAKCLSDGHTSQSWKYWGMTTRQTFCCEKRRSKRCQGLRDIAKAKWAETQPPLNKMYKWQHQGWPKKYLERFFKSFMDRWNESDSSLDERMAESLMDTGHQLKSGASNVEEKNCYALPSLRDELVSGRYFLHAVVQEEVNSIQEGHGLYAGQLSITCIQVL